jgi:hypothetical protein
MQIWLVDLSKNIWRNYIEPTSNSRSIVGLVLELICVTYNMKNIWKSTRRKKKDFLKYTQDKKPKQRFLSQNPNSTQNKRQFKYVTCIN